MRDWCLFKLEQFTGRDYRARLLWFGREVKGGKAMHMCNAIHDIGKICFSPAIIKDGIIGK